MKLFYITLFYIFFSEIIFSQVGIGNNDPKATLDLNLDSYSNGQKAGIAITKLTGIQIEAMNTAGLNEGTMVYATSTSSVITSTGFWYYNGTSWSKVGATTPSYTCVTLNKNSSYIALDPNDVIPNNVTIITFNGTAPPNFTISNLPAGPANVGKILSFYNNSSQNIAGSFNKGGDGAAASITMPGSRGFSMVWDGIGWSRITY